MSDESSNSQYLPGNGPFGINIPAGTGAPGSQGVQDQPAGIGGGAVIGTAQVSAPYGSSQLSANVGHLPVVQGDTSGMADDIPAHASQIMPGPQGSYMSDGPWPASSAGHFPHPAAGGGHA